MRFFFYGTLLDGSANRVAAWVHDRLHAIGPATVIGTLQGVCDPDGWYPALLAGDGQVHGRLYESVEGFGAADLARLDAYENYNPARPGKSLYLRETVTATAPDGSVCEAQAYRFNKPLPQGSRPIPGGDFLGWLAQEGLRAFGGLREG